MNFIEYWNSRPRVSGFFTKLRPNAPVRHRPQAILGGLWGGRVSRERLRAGFVEFDAHAIGGAAPQVEPEKQSTSTARPPTAQEGSVEARQTSIVSRWRSCLSGPRLAPLLEV